MTVLETPTFSKEMVTQRNIIILPTKVNHNHVSKSNVCKNDCSSKVSRYRAPPSGTSHGSE